MFQNKVLKFFGVCNSFDASVVQCLKGERLARRQRNYEMSLENKKKQTVKIKQEQNLS